MQIDRDLRVAQCLDQGRELLGAVVGQDHDPQLEIRSRRVFRQWLDELEEVGSVLVVHQVPLRTGLEQLEPVPHLRRGLQTIGVGVKQ